MSLKPQHTGVGKRIGVSSAVACIAFAATTPFAGIALGDPPPTAGAQCVPVRIISADGTWSEGDQKYLDQVIKKIQATNGGAANVQNTTSVVDDPSSPDAPAAANSLPSGTTTMVKAPAAVFSDNPDGWAAPGSATAIDFVYQIEASKYNDAGVTALLDDGWVPGTPATMKTLARQTEPGVHYTFMAQYPPVAVDTQSGSGGDTLLYADQVQKNRARDAWNKLTGNRGGINFGDQTFSNAEEVKAAATENPAIKSGQEYLNTKRESATNGTLRVVTEDDDGTQSKEGGKVIANATTKAKTATDQSHTPPAANIPADVTSPELAPVPDPWKASQDTGKKPAVETNSAAEPGADLDGNAPAAPDNNTLNGVPRGNAAPAVPPAASTPAAPAVETNENAPVPTTSAVATSEPEATPESADTETASASTSSSVADSETESGNPESSTNVESSDPDPDAAAGGAPPQGPGSQPAGYSPGPQKFTGDTAYDEAKVKAKKELSDTMMQVHKDCPDTMFALLGARQGAGAIGDLAADIGNGRGPVPADKVIGVGLISDPERTAMGGKETTVPDYNKRCIASNGLGTTLSSSQPVSPSSTAVDKGGTPSVATPSTQADAAAAVPDVPERTLGQDCDPQQPQGSGSASPQLVGPSVDGAGIYGGRTEGMGALQGRTATICMQSDATCATTRENSLVTLLAETAAGDQSKGPAAAQAALQSAVGLFKVLRGVDFGQVQAMSGDAQLVASNAPILAGAVGSLIAVPNPASAALVLQSGIPTAQGVLGVTGGVLKVAAQLVNVYEQTPELPQVVDFINLMNPDTAVGKKVLAAIPGGASPEVAGALRAVIPVLNALNSIPKGQVLSLGGDISKTLGTTLTDPSQIPMLLQQTVQLFTTVISASTNLKGETLNTVSGAVNPYPLGADGTTSTAETNYSTTPVNGSGTSATDWLGGWMGNQSQTAIADASSTSGVQGGAVFGSGSGTGTGTSVDGGSATEPQNLGPKPTYDGSPG